MYFCSYFRQLSTFRMVFLIEITIVTNCFAACIKLRNKTPIDKHICNTYLSIIIYPTIAKI